MVGTISANASALSAFSTRIAANAQDIANAGTAGFIGSRSGLVSNSQQAGGGVTARARLETEAPGVAAQTRSGTDIAVDGPGFLLVTENLPEGASDPVLTRAGSFQITADGFLRNANGQFLLGFALDTSGDATGELTAVNVADANGIVEIAANGIVGVQLEDRTLQPLFRLPLAAVESPNSLAPVNRTSFRATVGSGDINLGFAGAGNGQILAGALTSSNVNLEQELAQFILARQAFQANAAAVARNSELTDTLFDITG